jgi:hypothetical protein
MNERVRAAFLIVCEPLSGWHHAFARERRTAVDFAHEVDWLLSESPYKDAPKVRLVLDNLNTHVVASLYKAFPAVKARELVRRLEFHYTPRHGSWLNVAEISISILSKQCIDRRIPDLVLLNCEIGAWEKWYNSQCRVVKWQFTTDDARIKLHKLYPVF